MALSFIVSTLILRARDQNQKALWWVSAIDNLWYRSCGANICLVVLFHSFSSNIFEWSRYAFDRSLKFWDRGLRFRKQEEEAQTHNNAGKLE